MRRYNHGGDISEIQQIFPNATKPWIDLSTGINPNPYPWQSIIANEELTAAANKLPQNSDIINCKECWIKYMDAQNPDDWLLLSGSQAFINLMPRIFSGFQCVISAPTYNEHQRIWNLYERTPILIPHKKMADYDFSRNSVLILTNPNNPDGYIWDHEILIKLAEKLMKKEGFLIVDEAFADLMPEISLANKNIPDNVVILRSFGKFFGLAGLRLGIIKASKNIRAKVENQLGPWSVNALALKIAQYALSDRKWVENTLAKIARDMKQLKSYLKENDFDLIGSTDLFCLTKPENIELINNRLNHNGIYTRRYMRDENLMRFGLPKDEHELQRLKEALK